MNILEEIIAYKKTEVDKASSVISFDEIKKKAKSVNRDKRPFYQKLKDKKDKKEIGLIAEVKKASPSKGIIRKDFNPVEIACAYEAGGASCLSVLTDKKYFQGDEKYIEQIKKKVSLPILRKDFIVDPYQIYESVFLGADCVLLIVGAFTLEAYCNTTLLGDLYKLSQDNDLDILVEVHDERELEIALETCKGMSLVGINNRDLKTFETKLETTKRLVTKYKRDLENKVIVSESGIFKNSDIKLLNESDVYSFLVGESLMREKDIKKATELLLTNK
jgi:indole-3-glycerol phosphate synthase